MCHGGKLVGDFEKVYEASRGRRGKKMFFVHRFKTTAAKVFRKESNGAESFTSRSFNRLA